MFNGFLKEVFRGIKRENTLKDFLRKEIEFDNYTLSELKELKEKIDKAKEDFSVIANEIVEDLKSDIMYELEELLDEQDIDNINKEQLTADLKVLIKDVLEKSGYRFYSNDKLGEINIPLNELGEFKIVEKEKIIPDVNHDIIVGAGAVGGALLASYLLKKVAGKSGSLAGALIGGFIGSAAGSGISESVFNPKKIMSKRFDTEDFEEKADKILDKILNEIVMKFKPEITTELDRIEKKILSNLSEISRNDLELSENLKIDKENADEK